jgi:hypothetical protein
MVVSDVVTCLVPEYAKTRNAVPALVRDRGKRLHLDILDCILHGTATNELVKEFLETLPVSGPIRLCMKIASFQPAHKTVAWMCAFR